MHPVYEEISFVRNPEALWRKLEEKRWDWLGVKPDGQYVLGSPRREVGGIMAIGTVLSEPDAKQGGFGFTTGVPLAPASGSWFTNELDARFAFIEQVSRLRSTLGRPVLYRVQLVIEHEVVDEEFIVNNPSTYAPAGRDDIGARIVAAIGFIGAAELLDALTRPEADRAALIGRLALRADGEWLAEVLTDLEVDEVARLHMIEALRLAVGAS